MEYERTTRRKYDMEISNKYNQALPKRLQSLIADSGTSKELKDYLGVSVQALSQYKNGTAFPKTENLIKIAEFFGISVDYLLGITNVPNRDTTLQSINKTTGLSVDAIIKLSKFNSENHNFVNIISSLIESQNSEYFLSLIDELSNCKLESTTIDFGGKELKSTNKKILSAMLQMNLTEEILLLSKKIKTAS